MDFQVVLIEGVFYEHGGDYLIRPGPIAPTRSIRGELGPLVGLQLRLALHHLPPDLSALDESKWGGGACLWQPAPCPAGHHKRPGYLLNVSAEGTLQEDGGTWRLDRSEDPPLELPFPLMVGHYGRLAAATLVDMDKMRESTSAGDLGQIEALGSQLSSIKELLERMRQGS